MFSAQLLPALTANNNAKSLELSFANLLGIANDVLPYILHTHLFFFYMQKMSAQSP